jgi:exopolyphosphatase/pppGpp-phosphohydrolase
VPAQTEGFADILVPAVLVKGYINTTSTASMSFTFSTGTLKCGSSTFSSSAITVETVFNQPQNPLAINATRMSVLRFAYNKSEDELEKLGLTGTIRYAKRVLSEKIQEAAELLKDYEVSFDDLKHMIDKKIKE